MGTAFVFQIPAKQALFPHLVPKEMVPNAVTWNSTAFQTAAVTGPLVAGFLLKYAGGAKVFLLDAGLSLCVIVLVSTFRYRHDPGEWRAVDWDSLVGGVRFVRQTPLLLAAITLDLFAVLFAGATALLPAFVTDILHRDARSLGYLRAALALGAVSMAAFLAHWPLKKAGKTLLWAVSGFGLATIVFGLSRNFYLSLSMMVLLGALDNISVVIRHTLVQLLTPDRLLGRVQALNFLFIVSSNELGAFESGVVAALIGTVSSVVAGGAAAILVVLLVARLWPGLLKLDELKAPPGLDGIK
jgi:MFS family permease